MVVHITQFHKDRDETLRFNQYLRSAVLGSEYKKNLITMINIVFVT